MGMEADGAGGDSPVVRLVSIAQGNYIEGAPHPQRQLSWSDFDALLQQSKDMQDRLETLEQQQGVEEGVGLLEGEEKEVISASRSLGASPEPPQDRRMTEAMIDKRNDAYEMPESTYTLLTTEKVVSIPFFTGIIGR